MPLHPVRDRGTWISYAQIAAWSWFLYGFGATIALLRDEQGTTKAVSSLHGSMLALGALAGAVLSTRLIDRWGRGPVIRIAALAGACGIALYTTPGAPIAVTFTGVFLGGMTAGGVLIVAVNAYLVEHQGAAGPSALTEANALAALAGLIAPLAIGIGAATVLGWRAGALFTAVSLVAIEVWRGSHVRSFGAPRRHVEHEPRRHMPRGVYWALAALVCFMATEFCMTLWSADLLRERCGFGPAAAASSLSLITGGMLVGRTLGSRLARRHSTELLIRGATVTALLGFALAWTFTWPPVVLLGLFVVGLGISLHFPLGIARTIRASGGLTDRASALSSAYGSLGVAVIPFGLGALGEVAGLHLSLLIVPILLLTGLSLLIAWPVPDEISATRVGPALR